MDTQQKTKQRSTRSHPFKRVSKPLALSIAALFIHNTASAQQANSQDVDSLGSVVVTSQKREESIQEIPVTVTAISGDEIRDRNIVLNTDIEQLAPGLSAQGGGRIGKPRWFLRGIGTNDPNQTIEGPIGIYVDEVVVGLQRNQSFPLFDLERVEVLRGPQGTLWGKNNTGGTIHYLSKKPSYDNDGYGKLTFGNFGSRITEGAFGGTIKEETVAARLSVYNESLDGYATNILNGESGPKFKDNNIRLQVLANITPNLEAQIIYGTRDFQSRNEPTYAPGGTNLPPPNSAVTIPNADGKITTGQTAAQIAAGGGYIPPFGAFPDVYSPFFGGEGNTLEERQYLTAKLNWALDKLTFNSITGWSGGDGGSLVGVGVPLNTTLPRVSTKLENGFTQFSQEFRLSSPKDQTVSWIGGLYYYKLQADFDSKAARFANGGDTSVQTNRENLTTSSWDQDAESKAVFGNVKYQIDPELALTLGARYTRESKTTNQTALSVTDTAGNATLVDFSSESAWYFPGGVSGTGNFTPVNLTESGSWNNFTFDITPEYKVNKDLLLYGRVATGFRSGGFNQAISRPAGGTPFILRLEPEEITDYEVGFKSTLAGGKVQFNAAAFYYDLKNIQLNIQQRVQQTDGTFQTSSSGQSDGVIKGLEFEVLSKPVRNWNLGANLGLLRTEYKNFIYTVGNSAPQDASGNEFYRTPRTTFRLFTDYKFPINNSGDQLILGTDWSYRSKILHNATVQNDPVQTTPAYWQGNARATYAPSKSKWELTAFVRNLTDKNEAFLRQIVNTNGVTPVNVGAPRTYGVQALFKF
ncbi:TonB-dependent receptor [Limnobacter thiooxidans]|uniref:TonB-dependent receptor n=1 Tax=Limnobacter thiooxidans TaxID=131080 RepID=A0AA86MFB7_9BURK|nr:TonB-dependent receptor [Limnobacter thiooxidans]